MCVKGAKESAGKLLQAIRWINSISLPSDNFGVSCHTASSEPFFYDTAYQPVKRKEAIPVDGLGRCVVAKKIQPSVCSDHTTAGQADNSSKWECTSAVPMMLTLTTQLQAKWTISVSGNVLLQCR